MPMPLKALRYGQLKFITAGDAVDKSGHDVLRVEFEDTDGKTKSGFFKPLDPTYPPLLAKYAVAISVAIRLSLGDRAAEDRLVFNDRGEIKGTVSVSLANYKPLASYYQSLPSDEKIKEEVCPSVETLLLYNVAELLVAAWRYKCDDRHPGNFSLFGLIDWDMALYHYTCIIKGERLVDGITKRLPEKDMKLTSKALDNFPNIEGITHFPTKSVPGNFNVFKAFQSYKAFQDLAANQTLITDEEEISFQEQFFSALLKELLTHDPKMLYQRLKDYTGEELPLDYLSLEEEKHKKLAEKYPHLFNEQTNSEPFINHIMAIFEQEYRELYNSATYYPGCKKNDWGISVVGFSRFLRNKPSAYRKIIDWATNQNKRMEESWSAYQSQALIADEHSTRRAPDAYAVAPEGRYKLEYMEKSYHKIWRDSHKPTITFIIAEIKILARELANELRSNPLPPLAFRESLDLEESSSIDSWQILGEQKPIIESEHVDCEEDNRLKQALIALEEFISELESSDKAYWEVKLENLSSEHSQAFCHKISELIRNAEVDILDSLKGTSWEESFNTYITRLQELYLGFHFRRHLISKDVVLSKNAEREYTTLLARNHTDIEIVNACLQALFDWANTLESGALNDLILDTIKNCYEPSSWNFTAKRYRAEVIVSYLKKTTDDNTNRLAAIFSEGNTESTSLNTLLISKLIPLMLDSTKAQENQNLLSVSYAVERNYFNCANYAKKAQEFARNELQFKHVHSKTKLNEFSNILFLWASKLEREPLKKIILQALAQYEPYGFNWFIRKTRGPEIKKLLQASPAHSNEKLLALIFSDGGNEENSLNTILLTLIINTMKKEISTDRCGLSKISECPNKEVLQGYKQSQYFLTDAGFFYYNKLTGQCALITTNREQMKQLKEYFQKPKRIGQLSDENTRMITSITGHSLPDVSMILEINDHHIKEYGARLKEYTKPITLATNVKGYQWA
ncbi:MULTISPECIES: hypothetical protein [unclassified Legionella]|uniref:hypothetical protein n=1 Tax=unclassified Legionella TaxID=2622702 RepID=UPI001056B27B|nr:MULTISPECIES: hypothetical protein [unclassified Legionella]MDI9818042.1 hypothetical protein [Legionella sp. PL877]